METTKKNSWIVMIENFANRIKEIKRKEEIEPLCIDESIEYNITLSTGGPADGFKIYLNRQTRQPVRCCYYYSDWFTYEEEWLKDDDIDLIAEYFNIY